MSNNSPLSSDELTSLLRNKDNIEVHRDLGGFARKFLDQLQNDFKLTFPQPYSRTGNVFWQVFLDLIEDENEKIYFVLRSRFRATLAQCFGDVVIRSW